MLIDGDRVALGATLNGTDTGGGMNLPPTGKSFRVPALFLSHLGESHIRYERRVYDFTGLLIQVGVLKAKPA